MPKLKMGGATIVALAALFLAATSVQGAVVNLVIDQTASSLTLSGQINAPTIGQPNKAYQPQFYAPGSTVTSYSGAISIDLQPGTIQMLPGASIVAAISGNWAPAPGILGDPNSDPVGSFGSSGLAPANYGVMIPSFGVEASYRNLQFDFGVPAQPAIPGGIPSTPVGIDGFGNFSLLGQGMAFVGGTRRLLVSPLANDNSGVDGFPTLFGTNGTAVGSWDGTTLIIPVFSTLTYQIEDDPPIDDTVRFSGFIVARVVPEPSTMIMAGLGVVGLVAAGYRARKRKV